MIHLNGRVVKGKIQLDSPKELPEGARVTVTVLADSQPTDPESALDQELIAEGILTFQPASDDASGFLAYAPIAIRGEPLSKTITEERR
jgi:hypothetical protein